jgi:heme-degrading monooxygenase HmoA
MILELAVLDVRPGERAAFEAAFGEAKSIISAMAGFRHLELQHCLEVPDRYVLLVGWDRLEDHTEGFRGSPEYERWKALLHHFYDPFPTVEHYEPVISLGEPAEQPPEKPAEKGDSADLR